jgi:hypothetical protein
MVVMDNMGYLWWETGERLTTSTVNNILKTKLAGIKEYIFLKGSRSKIHRR